MEIFKRTASTLSNKITSTGKMKEHEHEDGMLNKVLAKVYNINTFSNHELSAEEILLRIYFIDLVQGINYSVHRLDILKAPYTKKKLYINFCESLKVSLH